MNTDPIADMLTRIRNANVVSHPSVELPSSKLKVALAKDNKNNRNNYTNSKTDFVQNILKLAKSEN